MRALRLLWIMPWGLLAVSAWVLACALGYIAAGPRGMEIIGGARKFF